LTGTSPSRPTARGRSQEGRHGGIGTAVLPAGLTEHDRADVGEGAHQALHRAPRGALPAPMRPGAHLVADAGERAGFRRGEPGGAIIPREVDRPPPRRLGVAEPSCVGPFMPRLGPERRHHQTSPPRRSARAARRQAWTWPCRAPASP
jgi:hypothetical protein